MTRYQLKRYSLRGRTFVALLIFTLVLAIIAITFGFFLFNASVTRQYRTTTWHLSKTAAHTIDTMSVLEESKAVLSIYKSMSEEELSGNWTEEYIRKFESVRDERFEKNRKQIHLMQTDNDAIAAYVAAIDEEHDRMIFIVDSDPKSSFCPPGCFDVMDHKAIETFVHGSKVTVIDRFFDSPSMPAIAVNMEKYGYRCTAGTMLFHAEGYPVMIFFDTDMNGVARTSRLFLLQYFLIFFIAALILMILMMRHIRRRVVNPINELADAARGYSIDKENQVHNGKHFADLNITTGDEIENLALTMKGMENDIAAYVDKMTRATAEKERINTELDVAKRIQMGMLPHSFPVFPDRPEFEIYATMHPAKEVGGDFYDFFLIDEDHLAILMADVSGKGVPAALFMMASKILINNYAATETASPAKILTRVNDAICKRNPAEMFVTVWLGILTISTGDLCACNAGHEYPCIRKGDGPFELFKDTHGFVVGGMEGMAYSDYHIRLKPGDMVYLYTDGVTEATDAENKLFGTERMLKALNLPKKGPRSLLGNVSDSIRSFVKEAAQFDDITMLGLAYFGPNSTLKKEEIS